MVYKQESDAAIAALVSRVNATQRNGFMQHLTKKHKFKESIKKKGIQEPAFQIYADKINGEGSTSSNHLVPNKSSGALIGKHRLKSTSR